ncbi:MAG: hypothetical protein RJB39_418 [Candidatus Parcubacteria bacterium]|jgi:hypothetical protein
MKSKLSILTLALAPFLASAQEFTFSRTIDGFLAYLIYLGGRIMPLLILAALVLFLFGIVRLFFFNKEADGKKNRDFVLYGIVALFVMVSVWGLVNILRSTFSLDNRNIPPPPAIPQQTSPMAPPTLN